MGLRGVYQAEPHKIHAMDREAMQWEPPIPRGTFFTSDPPGSYWAGDGMQRMGKVAHKEATGSEGKTNRQRDYQDW